jgi:hypothetical protein
MALTFIANLTQVSNFAGFQQTCQLRLFQLCVDFAGNKQSYRNVTISKLYLGLGISYQEL